jgi:hypothetical protein
MDSLDPSADEALFSLLGLGGTFVLGYGGTSAVRAANQGCQRVRRGFYSPGLQRRVSAPELKTVQTTRQPPGAHVTDRCEFDWSEIGIVVPLLISREILAFAVKRRYNLAFRRRSELVITETELKLIAAAAIIGLSSSPKKGNNTPAASGTPSML